MLFSQIIPPSPSPTESKSLFCTAVSVFLSCIQGYRYHVSTTTAQQPSLAQFPSVPSKIRALNLFPTSVCVSKWQMAQRVKHLPAMWETQVRSLGRDDSPGEGNGESRGQGSLVGYSPQGHRVGHD